MVRSNHWRNSLRCCIAAWFAAFAFGAAFAQGLVADDFRNSRFRGFHIEGVAQGPRSNHDLDALAKTGANMVRISVFLQRCGECSSYQLPQTHLATLDLTIRELAARNIYTVIVLRPAGDERGALWASTSLQNSLIDHWRMLAIRYQSLPSVGAFDLLNEPVPPGRTYDDRQSTWLAFATKLGRSIRELDPNRVLIVESAPDATPTSFSTLRPIPIDNVVYSLHSYLPIELTHQRVMKEYQKPMTYGKPGTSDVTQQDLISLLAVVDAFATKFNVPILVGEFSCVRWAPSGSAARYIADSISYFESKGWSWLYHDFRGWPGWDSEIDSELVQVTKRSDAAPIIKILRDKMGNKGR